MKLFESYIPNGSDYPTYFVILILVAFFTLIVGFIWILNQWLKVRKTERKIYMEEQNIKELKKNRTANT